MVTSEIFYLFRKVDNAISLRESKIDAERRENKAWRRRTIYVMKIHAWIPQHLARYMHPRRRGKLFSCWTAKGSPIGSFSATLDAHRSTLQLYCAIICGREAFCPHPAGKCRERCFLVAIFPPWNPSSWTSTMYSWLNSLMVAFIVRQDIRDRPVKSSGVVKCRFWPASGTPLSLVLLYPESNSLSRF